MAASNHVSRRYNNIVKSPSDQREYRGLELTNGLRVLLVSDPTTDMAAAAMDVNVGHLMDPWELQGLAHFCEHMVFHGTEKYPSENEFGQFVSDHGGYNNASTGTDSTNYQFSIKADQLKEALDRFAQFFLAPKFTESLTEREVLAVDSECSKSLKIDSSRIAQVEKHLSKANHDYRKFGCGNKKTLLDDPRKMGIEVRKALLDFHEQWYSSNIMSLCVVGSESLDALESLLESLDFVAIKNKNVKRMEWLESPYGREQLGKRIEIVPIEDTRSLSIEFPIPDLRDEYKSEPARYISHLLDHEQKGSLFSELKRLGWVSSLSASTENLARGMSIFRIDITLSTDGLDHIDEIIQLVFNYIGLLKRSGPVAWIQEELRDLGELHFRFMDKAEPLEVAESYSTNLQFIPFQDILSSDYLIPEFDPDRIMEIIDMLTPSNMFYLVIAKKYAGQQGNVHEPYYGTEIHIKDIDDATMESFNAALNTVHPALHLPVKNEYIPTRMDLKPREAVKQDHPSVIYDCEWCRIWFKQDDEFERPKAVTRVALISPMSTACAKSTMLLRMFISCLDDALTDEICYATEAGLYCSIEEEEYGLILEVSGYDEKQPQLVEHIIKRMINFKPDPLRFEVLFDEQKRSLKNAALSEPITLSSYYLTLLLTDRTVTNEHLLTVCKDLSVHEVEEFGKEMLRTFFVEFFIHGNVTEQEALTLSHTVTNLLRSATNCRPMFRNEYLMTREHAIEDGNAYVYRHFQKTHDESSVEVLYQVGVQNTKENALMDLIVQLLEAPAFHQLRTVEQLGYVVSTDTRVSSGSAALQLIVQGPGNPAHVHGRIEAFLEKIREEIVSMTEEEFEKKKAGVIAKNLDQPKTLTARSSEFWDEIESRQYDFDRRNAEVKALRSITKDDVLKFFDLKFTADAPQRRKIVVFVYGKDDNGGKIEKEAKDDSKEKLEEIACMEQFRHSLPLYGLPRPKLNLLPVGADPLSEIA